MSAVLLLAGCAQPQRQAPAPWSGRLALSIQSEPAQSYTAGFELRGSASQGELQLFSPLGNTLAVLSWTPVTATLRQGAQEQSSDSLEALVLQATGVPIPLKALFDWVANVPTAVAGWRADLSRLGQGRLQLRRFEPAPEVELRLQLDPN
ncbi:MAG: lipoprotein insertase outer membrane protein LolB [Betaproteobacteria bacterium]